MTVCKKIETKTGRTLLPRTQKRQEQVRSADVKHRYLRLLLTLGFVATLPMTWGKDCEGNYVSGMELFRDHPSFTATVVSLLFFSVVLALVVDRFDSVFARASIHILAVAISGHATFTVVERANDLTLELAGKLAIAFVALCTVDAVVRTLQALTFCGRGLWRTKIGWMTAWAALTLVVFEAGLLLMGLRDVAALAVLPLVLAPLGAAYAGVWLAAAAQARRVVPEQVAIILGGTSFICGFLWMAGVAGPNDPSALLLALPLLGGLPWLIAPVVRFHRSQTLIS